MIPRVSVIVCVTALAVAGCGSNPPRRVVAPPPKLPRVLATQLAALGDTVAQKLDAGDSCGALTSAAELQSRAAAAVASGQVQRRLRSPLLNAAARLQAEIRCVPPAPQEHHDHHDDHGDGHDKGHGGGGGD